jgi:hypothetical protein
MALGMGISGSPSSAPTSRLFCSTAHARARHALDAVRRAHAFCRNHNHSAEPDQYPEVHEVPEIERLLPRLRADTPGIG